MHATMCNSRCLVAYTSIQVARPNHLLATTCTWTCSSVGSVVLRRRLLLKTERTASVSSLSLRRRPARAPSCWACQPIRTVESQQPTKIVLHFVPSEHNLEPKPWISMSTLTAGCRTSNVGVRPGAPSSNSERACSTSRRSGGTAARRNETRSRFTTR